MSLKKVRPRTPLALSVLVILSGCREESGTREEESPAVSAEIFTVASRAVAAQYHASGTVRPRSSAELSSKVVGHIREVRVKAGDRIQPGQVLAVIDSGELEARLRQARAGREASLAACEEAEKGLAAAEAGARLATATYQRFQALAEKRAATRQELDEVESRYRSAKAQEDMAAAGLKRAQSAVEQAEAELAAAEALFGYTRITAPFEGTVLERRVDPGTLAAPGVVLLVVAEAGAFRVEASVGELQAGAIEKGDLARVSLEGRADAIEARVSEILPAISAATRDFVVKLDLPADFALRPGMFARVTFEVGQAEKMLVPVSAVMRRGQLDTVFVVEEGRARLRLVTIGLRRGERLEVLSGLSEGERILSAPPAGTVEGARIAVVP